VRELSGRDAAEAPGSRTLGQALHHLPGKEGTGPVIKGDHCKRVCYRRGLPQAAKFVTFSLAN